MEGEARLERNISPCPPIMANRDIPQQLEDQVRGEYNL
jgi:hypothetical protein